MSVNDIDYGIRVSRTVPRNCLELDVEPDSKVLLRKEADSCLSGVTSSLDSLPR